MSQSDLADTGFVECAQQIEIIPERLDAFQRDKKTDLSLGERARNFPVAATNDTALRLLGFGVKTRDLIERNLDSLWARMTDDERRKVLR